MFAQGKGVLQTSVNFLLNQNEINALSVSMIDLYENQFSDLMGSDHCPINVNSSGKKIETSANKIQISTMNDLETLVISALKKRTTKATDQNITSSRSHAFTIIETSNLTSQLVFADLAGFESSNNKENVNESISINLALSKFNKLLLDLRQKRIPNYNEHLLSTFLQPVLKQTKATVFYHISEPNIAKNLNLIDQLLEVRVNKRVASKTASAVPVKTIRPMKF